MSAAQPSSNGQDCRGTTGCTAVDCTQPVRPWPSRTRRKSPWCPMMDTSCPSLTVVSLAAVSNGETRTGALFVSTTTA